MSCFPALLRRCALLLAALLLAAPAPAADALEALHDVDRARILATEQDRPMLIVFSRADCAYCRRLERDVLPDPGVREVLRRFVLVVVDTDHQPQTAAWYRIAGVPAFVVETGGGRVVDAAQGFQPPEAFRRWLLSALGDSDPLAARRQAVRDLMSRPEWSAEDGRALRELLADPEVTAVAREGLLAREPFPAAVLVAGLRDERLAVRLACLELLEDVHGEDLGYSPWATGEEAGPRRQKALERWEQWAGSDAAAAAGGRLVVPLSRAEVQRHLHQYVTAEAERSERALRVLLRSGRSGGARAGVLAAAREYGEAHRPLSADGAARLRKLLWALQMPTALAHRAETFGHRLAYGSQEVRLQTIKELRAAAPEASRPLLGELLADADPLVREVAAEELATIPGAATARLLVARLQPPAAGGAPPEADGNVRITIMQALKEMEAKTATAALCAQVGRDEMQSVAALEALAVCAGKNSGPLAATLKTALAHESWRVRVAALKVIQKKSEKSHAGLVRTHLEDPEPFVVETAIQTVARLKDYESTDALLRLFRERDELKASVIQALHGMDRTSLLPEDLYRAVKEKPLEVQLAVGRAAAALDSPRQVRPFLAAEDPQLVAEVVAAVGEHLPYNEEQRRRRFQQLLESTAARPEPAVRRALCLALRARPLTLEAAQAAGRRAEDAAAAEGPDGAEDGDGADGAERAASVLAAFGGGDEDPPAGETDGAGAEEAAATAGSVLAAFGQETGEAPAAADGDGSAAVRKLLAGEGLSLGEVEEAAVGLLSAWVRGESPGGSYAATETLTAGDETVAYEAALTLTAMGSSEGLSLLRRRLPGAAPEEKRTLAQALRRPRGAESLALLATLLESPEEGTRRAALGAVAAHVGARAAELLLAALERSDPVAAAGALADFAEDFAEKTPAARARVERWIDRTLAEGEGAQRHLAVLAAGWCRHGPARLPLRRCLEAEDEFLRRSALLALHRIEPAAARRPARRLARDPSAWVRRLAARLLVRAGEVHDRPGDLLDAETPVHFYRSGGYVSGRGESVTFLTSNDRALLDELSQDQDRQVRVYARLGLLRGGVRIDFAALAADLRAGDSVRSHGLLQLVRNPAVTRHADSLALVKLLLEDDSSYIRDEAKEILRRYSSPEALALLADRRPGTEDEAEAPAAAGGAGAFRFRPAAPPDDAPAETGAAPERAYLAYFHRPGCPDCHRVSAMLAELQPLFPQLKIRRYDVTRTDALLANEAMSERAGVPEKDRLVAPALFTVAQALVKDDTTRERTVDLLAGATGLPPPWTGLEQDADAAQRAIVRRYESTSLMTVLPAGLLDGLNPCAFTTIIFLLSYLAYQGHSRRQILAVGAVFTAAVFVTYYLVGLGFLLVILELSFYSWLSEGIYWLTAGFAFVIGALSIRDGIKAYQGRLGESALQLPAFLKKRIHKTIHRGASVRRGLLAAAAAGFAVSLLELACTGQVYGPTLIVLSRVPGYAWSARFYLLLYNLMFVLPLVVVFALAYFGLTSEKLTRFFRRHAALVRFLTAGLFFFFFAFMVIQMS